MKVRRERKDEVEVVTIDRPEVRNAVDAETAAALWDAFEAIDADPTVRVAILTGAGDRAFCAGQDLKQTLFLQGRGARRATIPDLCRRGLEKPLIGAVRGFAVGGGLELLLCCDLVVASEDASFGLPEARRGLLAGAGGVARLPARVGPAVALELTLTGDPIGAQRAFELGLVNRVVPSAEVLPIALALAARICECAPLAVRLGKRLSRAALGVSEEEGWKLSEAALAEVLASEDAREGTRAFAEKRAPHWKGR